MKQFKLLLAAQIVLIAFYYLKEENPAYMFTANWIAGVLAGIISVVIVVQGFSNLSKLRKNRLNKYIFFTNCIGLVVLVLWWWYIKWQLRLNYS